MLYRISKKKKKKKKGFEIQTRHHNFSDFCNSSIQNTTRESAVTSVRWDIELEEFNDK